MHFHLSTNVQRQDLETQPPRWWGMEAPRRHWKAQADEGLSKDSPENGKKSQSQLPQGHR